MQQREATGTNRVADAPSERRRTQRVHIAMPVRVRGKIGTQTFQEETTTASVNAHGCMVHMAQSMGRGQQVTLFNHANDQELTCTVTFLGPKDRGKTEVGLEFLEASPRFWNMHFPPDDWDPAERKRPGPVKR
ncbi:MAG TPA: PilZ domain-containing protein [Candidatus Acidoferrales bacterium]|nr:PilZ domain-containing protein [Candidatus Acidoferrales bacterium]